MTWTSLGQKRIVWRCVNRLDNGKKYCQHSPTLSEPALQEAIVRALNKFNDEDTSTYLTLMKATIGEAIGANGGSDEIDLLERRIDALNSRMLKMVSDSVERGADMEENEDEFKTISEQIEQLNRRIEAIRKSEGSDEDRQERLSLIQATIDQREANRDTYVEQQIQSYPFDIVLSHTCPFKYEPTEMFLSGIDQSTVDDSTERWLDTIEEAIEYKAWFCGHWHTDKRIDKMHFLFHSFESDEQFKKTMED